MRRRSTTTGFMVDESLVLQETVGVLYSPGRGVAIFVSGHAPRRVASCRTREESSRSEFVRVPLGFLSEIIAAMILGGHGCCHKRLVPDMDGFSHNPPALMKRCHRILGG